MTPLFKLPDVGKLATTLHDGGLVAYPTEAVFGLGCDPYNEAAVRRICALKAREVEQGLLLVAGHVTQIRAWVDWSSVPKAILQRVQTSWPGPTTWILPRGAAVPRWVTGDREGIAVRVTAHLPTATLCNAFGGAVISTSANPHGHAPARDTDGLLQYFAGKVDAVLDEQVGNAAAPSQIIDALTGKIIRS